jgi:DNA-binding NarL/FixJ family response regulator
MGGGDSRRHRKSERLIGRDGDIAFLRSFVDEAATRGGALLLSGDAGVGKTALLDLAADHATARGFLVLRSAGAEFEVNVSFAGLNQLLLPIINGLDKLPALQGRALRVALGVEEGPASDELVVFNAALALLLQAALARPLVAIVDDLPWLDRASAVALGFVARRLSGSPIGVLAASRAGEEGLFERAGLLNYMLGPLDDAAACALLLQRFPALAPRVRQRLMEEAQGNPLALLELPAALSGWPRTASAGPRTALPLSGKLQAVFATRVGSLPSRTRAMLLLAVLDGTGDLTRLKAVASDQPVLEVLAAAERAQLVNVNDATGRLEFRHTLTGSAVVALATSDERRGAHRALADHLPDRDERRAWHLAAAALGPDKAVAELLEKAAGETLGRGDPLGAVCTLLRSAQLSPGGADRSRRLAEAAYLGAAATGDLRDVPQLLEDALRADPQHKGSLAAAVAASYHLISGAGDVSTAHALLVGALEMIPGPHDAEDHTFVEALYTLLLVCFFAGRAELWQSFDVSMVRLTPGPPELLAILAETFSDPVRRAPPVLDRLDATIVALRDETDPARIVRVGMASAYVDRLPSCHDALWRAVENGRAGGAITSAIEALFLLANSAFWTGEWDELAELTDEGIGLCEAHGYTLMSWPGIFLRALLAAGRGDDATTRALTERMAGWAAPRGVRSVQNYAWHARALAALGRGDFEEGYQQAALISPPGTLASHVPHALWVILDLVEAAVHTGRHAEAGAHVAAVAEADVAAMSPRLALVTFGSAAIAAPIGQDAELFEKALAVPDCHRWPFDLARVQLAYGERLRRAKARSVARTHLAAARDTFQRLGALPWMARAEGELRATGLSIGQTQAFGAASLTPQQLEIARLAAAGLTNKEIGERLFLSHRTVGTHLYQLFPKLGITSRAALSAALGDLPAG